MNRFDTPLDHGPLRLRLGAAAGVLGVLAGVGRVLLGSNFDEQHTSEAIAWAGAHPTAAFVTDLCEMLAFGLIAFSCLTLTGLVRSRGRWLTQVGGWGTGISWLVIAFNSLGVVIAALGDYPDRASATAVLHHAMHSAQTVPLVILLVSSALWPLLFGFGLCRAGLVGWWYAGLVVVWTVLEVVVSATGLVALVANIVPMALVVGVWARLLLDRASAVEASPVQPERVTV